LKARESKECVNCHFPESMSNAEQPHVRVMHITSRKDGEPCTECHKGIAHKAPEEAEGEAASGQGI
jgi:cytochrome c-type protein NapC